VQQALREHGLISMPAGAIVAADRDAVATRRPGTLPAIVVKDGPKQPVNVFLGTATRIVLEATIEGEMPERDYDLVLDLIRREVGEVGQIGSVGRTFSWSVSNQNRKLQISVMPRGGKTTVRIDEQLSNIAGGVFGGIMGGGGGGLGGMMMGIFAGSTHQPLIGVAAWLATIGVSFGAARTTLRHVAKNKHTKLTEIAHLIANEIAESTASAQLTTGDGRRRTGDG